MLSKQFKARPLNKRVLESCGDLGVPVSHVEYVYVYVCVCVCTPLNKRVLESCGDLGVPVSHFECVCVCEYTCCICIQVLREFS